MENNIFPRTTEKQVTLYKGIHFNNAQEFAEFHENGAHFKYTELCNLLEKVYEILPPERKAKNIYEEIGTAKDHKLAVILNLSRKTAI
jgi:hypothetical protein